MFWLKKLKSDSGRSSWVTSYGDLMSLLLAVFVMIAAMSELGAGRRFDAVSLGVRSAFGFSETDSSPIGPRPQSLYERLERAGLQRTATVNEPTVDQRLLAPCEVVTEKDRVMIRIDGRACFEPLSASLELPAQRAVRRVADFLAGGHTRIEIRGHYDESQSAKDASVPDRWDLSYKRAHAVAALLKDAGVSPHRMQIIACGDSDPLVTGKAFGKGWNRRIEIIVSSIAARAE